MAKKETKKKGLKKTKPEPKPLKKAKAEKPKVARKPHPETDRRITTLDLPVKLTRDEKASRGNGLASKYKQRAVLKAQRKLAMDTLGNQIKVLDDDIVKDVDVIDSGMEVRPVKCWEDHNYATGTVVITRSDTDEFVRDRPMNADERQTSLPIEKPAKTEAAAPPPKPKKKPKKVRPSGTGGPAIENPQSVLDGFDDASQRGFDPDGPDVDGVL